VARCQAQRHPGQAFAVRFAAKEAFAKAIGTGLARGLKWLDIEVRRIESGQPALVLAGAAQREAHRLGVSRIHLSLSHEKGMAVAMVVLES
jgi:holo-[acyl-carrier protein] synthase